MGNMCSGHRKECLYDVDKSSFGMLCKRPYEKEVVVKFNLRNSLGVPDTSVMVEGDKSYVYKINNEDIANKTLVKTGIRSNKNIEIISGLTEGDVIVAEGLKKVRPRGKIKPINK